MPGSKRPRQGGWQQRNNKNQHTLTAVPSAAAHPNPTSDMSTRRIDVPFEPMEMEGQRSRGNTRPWRFWAATAAGVVCLWVVLAATVLGTTAFVFSRNSQVRTSNDLLVAKANGNRFRGGARDDLCCHLLSSPHAPDGVLHTNCQCLNV